MSKQKTILNTATFSGVGLHSGENVQMVVHPADEDQGICFVLNGAVLPASHLNVDHTPLCTLLRGPGNLTISTIEHFMAAAWALGLTNLIVSLDKAELPILDGSALPFVQGLMKSGVALQGKEAKRLAVVKEVSVRLGQARASLHPAQYFSAAIDIDFAAASIGYQSFEFDGTFETFMADIAMSRTFCMAEDIASMRASGRALGGSLENAVVFERGYIVNEDGLRVHQEPVRHKMLDVIGDLYLMGAQIDGHISSSRPGHKLTNMLLREAVRQGALVAVGTNSISNQAYPKEFAA